MSHTPDAILPPLSSLLRNNSSTSSGSSSPPTSPGTPRSVDGLATTQLMDMDAKRRGGPPPPLNSLPSLAMSIPLTRKNSDGDERRNISSLLNGTSSRPSDDMYPAASRPAQPHAASQTPSSHGPFAPHHHPAPPPPHYHRPPPGSAHRPQSHQQYPSATHPDPPHPATHDHHASQAPPPHLPYPPPHQPQQHYHHAAPSSAAPPLTAPLIASAPAGPQPRDYYSPPVSRQSHDYRPPTAPHPDLYARPDMGRRHTYHPSVYEYPPMYDMAMPMGYGPYMTMPYDSGLGARAPISRTTKACDACRARKVRCDAGGVAGQTGVCSRCRESGRRCFYTATQKKRGPTPGRPARVQSAGNVPTGRRGSIEASTPEEPRRATWSSSGRPPSSAGSSRQPGLYSLHSAGPEPSSSAWPSQHGYDERDVRHHPYRPSSGPRTAPLVDREARVASGSWDQLGPPPPPMVSSHGGPQSAGPHHEPRQPPVFDDNYSLHPHPSAGWPQHARRDGPHAPEYTRRSLSPASRGVQLAPLRRQ